MMDYPSILVVLAVEGIQFVQNWKLYTAFRTLAAFATVVFTGYVFCSTLHAEPSLVAPCDRMTLNIQLMDVMTASGTGVMVDTPITTVYKQSSGSWIVD